MSSATIAIQKKLSQTRAAQVVTAVRFFDTAQARIYMLAAVALLGITYIWLVNSSTAAQFTLNDLRKQSVTLEDQYQKEQLQQTALRSLEKTQESSAALNLVAAGKVQYAASDSAVALAGSSR